MINEKDLEIILEFWKLPEDEEFTTWKFMRKLYPQGRENENENLKNRMRKMAKLGLFFIEGKPEEFTLIKDNVIKRKFSFPDRRSKGIAIRTNNKWAIIEL